MKTFLVINLSYFGDVILTGSLCQNIKEEYPDSKIIFMVNKPFKEAAQYLDGVDDVISIDKRGKHKGLLGLFKIVSETPYKNIDAAFVIYGNARGVLISKLLGVKEIITSTHRIHKYFCTKSYVDYGEYVHTQDHNACYLKPLTGKDIKSLPVKYNIPQQAVEFAQELLKDGDFVGICPVSKRAEKDIPLDDCKELISKINSLGKTLVITGTGGRCAEYVERLRESHCGDFVDLVNKTSISELAAVIQKCLKYISVDTGSMHLACAVGVDLICLFYIDDEKHLKKWAPKDFYKNVFLKGKISVDEIVALIK